LKAERSPEIEPKPAPSHVKREGPMHDHF